MAYASKEIKSKIVGLLKALHEVELYNIKYTLSVQERRTFVLTIKSATINFAHASRGFLADTGELGGQLAYYGDATQPELAKEVNGLYEVLTKLNDVLEVDNYDNSDSMTDYFDVGYYTQIKCGTYEKAFVYDPSGKARKEAKVIGDAMGRKGMRTQSKQVGSKRL